MPNTLELCKGKKEELDALRPLAPEQERRVLQKLRLEWDFHSNHLEGNSLSYGETRALILHGLTAQGKPLKDHFEITGHHDAVLWVEDLVQDRHPLTEAVIRQLHVLILKEDHQIEAVTPAGQPTKLLVEVGKYKSTANHVETITGETLFFSSPGDTPIHMQELLAWYEASDGIDPIELASLFHHRFTRIHPFTDGNGRVARLVSNFILMKSGYPPVIIKTQDKGSYFAALRLADEANPKAFVDYIADRLLDSLDLVLRGARGENVDEPDDIRKELALLRQQFEASERVDALKSPERIQIAWEGWLRQVVVDFDQSASQFEPFYLQRHTHLTVGNTSRGASLQEQLDYAPQGLAGAHQISLTVTFQNIRARQHVGQHFSQSLFFMLLDTHIEVQDGVRTKIGEIGWDVRPTDVERRSWITAEERRHLSFLKPLLQREK